jgi:hypothetical protein
VDSRLQREKGLDAAFTKLAQAVGSFDHEVGRKPDVLYEQWEHAGYQASNAVETFNCFFLSYIKGLLLACSQPVSGSHHNMFEKV